MSGAFAKPLLDAGWSPAAAVTVRAFFGGLALAPVAIVMLRGKWHLLWSARKRIALIGLLGIIGAQFFYFSAIETIPVSVGILIEFTAPLLLVAFAWITWRKAPAVVVLVGSVISIGGLVLVVSPGSAGALDPLGLIYASLAAVCCAGYFYAAADTVEGLPAIAVASVSLVLAGFTLGLLGLVGVTPLTVAFVDVELFGGSTPWWVPLSVITLISASLAYVTSIGATEILGSRVSSFLGLLEVVAATVIAWILLGQAMTVWQVLGGILVIGGIAFVRMEKATPVSNLEAVGTGSIPVVVAHERKRGLRHIKRSRSKGTNSHTLVNTSEHQHLAPETSGTT